MTFENVVVALLVINVFVNAMRIGQREKDYRQGFKDGIKSSYEIGKMIVDTNKKG